MANYNPALSIPVRVGSQANWQLVYDKTTADGKTFNGKAQTGAFTFTAGPEQIDFVNNWLVNNFVDELQRAAVAKGEKVLRVKLWRDTGPTWSTPYKGELTVTNTGTLTQAGLSQSAALAVVPIVGIILVAGLAAIVYWLIVRPLLGQVTDFIYGPENPDGTRTPWYQSLLLPAAILGGIYLVVSSDRKKPARRRPA